VNNLESLERGTVEFQALTPEEQNHRRKMLSSILEGVLEKGIESGISEREAGKFAGIALKFYLTRKVEELQQNPKAKKSRK